MNVKMFTYDKRHEIVLKTSEKYADYEENYKDDK